MTVYILHINDGIYGCYSTNEKAEKVANELYKNHKRLALYIECYEVE